MNPKTRRHIGFNDPGERRVACPDCGEEIAISDGAYHRAEECDSSK